jgi:hypothetical protein
MYYGNIRKRGGKRYEYIRITAKVILLDGFGFM